MRIHHYETDSHFQLVESCGSYIVIDAQENESNAFGDLQSALWNIIGQIRGHILSALTLQRLRAIGKKHNLNTHAFSGPLLEWIRSNEIDNVFYDTAFFAMLRHYKSKKRYDLILANHVNFLIDKEVAHSCKKYLSLTTGQRVADTML